MLAEAELWLLERQELPNVVRVGISTSPTVTKLASNTTGRCTAALTHCVFSQILKRVCTVIAQVLHSNQWIQTMR